MKGNQNKMFREKAPEKKATLILQLPAEVKHLFKAWCAKHNITMIKAIELMMRDKIKEG